MDSEEDSGAHPGVVDDGIWKLNVLQYFLMSKHGFFSLLLTGNRQIDASNFYELAKNKQNDLLKTQKIYKNIKERVEPNLRILATHSNFYTEILKEMSNEDKENQPIFEFSRKNSEEPPRKKQKRFIVEIDSDEENDKENDDEWWKRFENSKNR
ncbi:hypothetical protein L3Y34_019190 [Caenorhabditis briggsae]|uniref:Uncharacterized protein n=1 Tax=Caenorhabditis briggsae TaxID=6238 RepID=A0AAE9DM91_CAEBR|nr:hypothetical protein L3Y34_019190 [Caenorhabditis briggsae]